LFQNLCPLIPQIDLSFKKICDSELRIDELDAVLKKVALNKSPDGLTVHFYKYFWEDLRNLLSEALKECIVRKELMTMKQGEITLIPKPGKDKRQLDNLRPITLLNTDYKVFSGSIATRLKKGIADIISETQSGFIKGRVIYNNIRLVMNSLDYSDLIDDDRFILFLDFYKAFDSVEHKFILKTLHHFGFGDKFKDTHMLYSDIRK